MRVCYFCVHPSITVFLEIVVLSNCLHYSIFFESLILLTGRSISRELGVIGYKVTPEGATQVLKFVDLQICKCSGEDSGLRSLHLKKVQRTLVPTLFITGQLEPPALFPFLRLLTLYLITEYAWLQCAAFN